MEDKKIDFGTAILAKEKGFNINCKLGFYSNNDTLLEGATSSGAYVCSQALLQRWLREVHKIHIQMFYQDEILNYRSIVTTLVNNTEVYESPFYSEYEYVLELGLLEALKLI